MKFPSKESHEQKQKLVNSFTMSWASNYVPSEKVKNDFNNINLSNWITVQNFNSIAFLKSIKVEHHQKCI